ncbi:response regulator [Pelagibacterium xiamenense]|uniref:response regulator n=1 Tax=Pelagibacterium xiamenense TaxID=2901140 RepID=UPI001E3479CA|nr:response regulator [Pelagibacterium xiamenense]MCD7059414.1 response regulator [Pelagibacterium xiamenense]
MTESVPTIAVLSSSPALASILGATLRSRRDWRVREFRDARSLNAYMRIAPVAMLVSDFTLEDGSLTSLAHSIRNDEMVISKHVQIIAMSRTISPGMRRDCVAAGIDEVIVKPMSPIYLKERIGARIANGPADHITVKGAYTGPERRGRIPLRDRRDLPFERRGDNVVSLAAHRAQRQIEARPE